MSRRERSSADFSEEIRAHIELEADRLVEEEGLSRPEALARARQAFGSAVRARKRFEDASRWTWLRRLMPEGLGGGGQVVDGGPAWRRWADDLARDIALGARSLARDRALAAFAILIIGLGVGASATVFSVANALLIRPLPFEDPDRLVFISNGEWDGDRRSGCERSALTRAGPARCRHLFLGHRGLSPVRLPGRSRAHGAWRARAADEAARHGRFLLGARRRAASRTVLHARRGRGERRGDGRPQPRRLDLPVRFRPGDARLDGSDRWTIGGRDRRSSPSPSISRPYSSRGTPRTSCSRSPTTLEMMEAEIRSH